MTSIRQLAQRQDPLIKLQYYFFVGMYNKLAFVIIFAERVTIILSQLFAGKMVDQTFGYDMQYLITVLLWSEYHTPRITDVLKYQFTEPLRKQ